MRIHYVNTNVVQSILNDGPAIVKKESAFSQWLKGVSNDREILKTRDAKILGRRVTNMPMCASTCKAETFANGIPTELHFVWEGNDISEEHLSNILLNAAMVPNFNVNIWTTRPGAIYSTLEKMMSSETNVRYRNLARNFCSAITVKDTNKLYDELKLKLNSYNEHSANINAGEYLASMFAREINGIYKNYAAASDITRAALMFLKGGCYLDVDAVCTSLNKIEKSKIPQGYLIGAVSTDIMANAFLVSLPQSEISKTIIETMAARLMSAEPDTKIATHAKPDIEGKTKDKKDNMLLWVNKRSNQASRFSNTLKMTGPQLLTDLKMYEKSGIYFKADIYSTSDDSLKQYDELFKPFFKARLKNMLTEEKSAGEVLFAHLEESFNDSSSWAYVKNIKKDSITL
ncbi:glycosyltransferase [Vagococcus sp. WN89Y]|uniref:glycosyltransferase n=1 Tax=Vagococcus sp. WN89Y TaxID=3457258 RepID=UPI003FCC8D97